MNQRLSQSNNHGVADPAPPVAIQWGAKRAADTLEREFEYLIACGLEPHLEPHGDRRFLLSVDSTVGAVVLPTGLARTVTDTITETMPAGPVFEEIGARRWTILVFPDRGDVDVSVELGRRGVHIATGAIVLPSSADAEGRRRWVQPPKPDRELPGISLILGILGAG